MKHQTVLVVDDDPDIRDSLQEFLKMEEFTVRTAENGRVGLAAIRELRGQCVVLLDLQMPVMTGEQLLQELEVEPDPPTRNTPIIVITASTAPVKHTVAGFIQKPMDLDLLLDTIQSLA